MANLESTAINDLIHRVGNRPLTRESAVEVTFQPSPQAPPAAPIARTLPLPRPRPPAYKPTAYDSAEVTVRVARKAARSYATIGMFAIGSFMIGIAGFYLVRGGMRAPATAVEVHLAASEQVSDPAPAPVAPARAAAPAPPVAPAPAVAPAQEPTPAVAPAPLPTSAVVATAQVIAPTLVDLRLDSQPSGASVILIDRGKSAPLGTTPLQASVDPTREYDLVFSLPGRPPRLEHVDPRSRLGISVSIAAPLAPTPPPPRPHAKPRPKRASTRNARR